MGERNREPVTKELLRIEPPAKKLEEKKGPQTLRHTPPPIPKSRVAHAGRERLDETPVILDPEIAVRIEQRPSDSAEIPVITAHIDPLMMDSTEFRGFMRSAKCVDKKDFEPDQFANRIMFAQPKNERNGGARYIAIMGDDGNAWRLYPHMESLMSIEKFEKCRFAATLEVGGSTYLLYWETPELKQK